MPNDSRHTHLHLANEVFAWDRLAAAYEQQFGVTSLACRDWVRVGVTTLSQVAVNTATTRTDTHEHPRVYPHHYR